ncbi:AraC family transcriptional regulator [Flavisphingomonas formosensis]|uniref:AraC family transcriptional regulator n=1 Tax=Flavisphingomonas formosensis TaxID=861534 RepID=UPI0018DEFDAE|nr:AraC family transcriptional regulator [Sphingomonas formosensis]
MQFGPALRHMMIDHHYLVGAGSRARPPFPGESFASAERLEALGSVSRVFFPHEVVVQSATQQLDFRHCYASLREVSLNQISYGADVDVLIDGLRRSHFVLVIALSGSATVDFEGRSWSMQAGDCLLMNPDTRYAFQIGADHRHLAIGIPARRLLGSGAPYQPVHNIAEHMADAPCGGAGQLISFLDYLCGEFHAGSRLFGLARVAAANEASLVELLRAALFEEEAAARAPGVLPGFVHRAERFISAHLDEDIGLDDIVEAARVPVRTLYHGFDRFLGHSPMRWLRLRRLEQARADILASDGALSVTALANRYWMGHSGRFASLYREMYSEAPSATIERVRLEQLRLPS